MRRKKKTCQIKANEAGSKNEANSEVTLTVPRNRNFLILICESTKENPCPMILTSIQLGTFSLRQLLMLNLVGPLCSSCFLILIFAFVLLQM